MSLDLRAVKKRQDVRMPHSSEALDAVARGGEVTILSVGAGERENGDGRTVILGGAARMSP